MQKKIVLKYSIRNNINYRQDKRIKMTAGKVISALLCFGLLCINTAQALEAAPAETLVRKEFDTEKYYKKYKHVTKDGVIMQAMEIMNGENISRYSYNALLGSNLTNRPFKIEFKDLSKINPEYASFDALGWQKPDKLNKSKETLYIYINENHRNAPPEAIAALLTHEAVHQDKFPSLNEETYAWTLEAAAWTKFTEKNPDAANSPSSLVSRENMLKKLFIKGSYTNKYIKKAVYSNPGYQKMPVRSPGFEDENL